QIERALSELDGSKEDESIHSARKRFKKIRAALRLVRDDLGDDVYRRENHCFRDAAQPLTQIRDATVLRDALDKLLDYFSRQVRHATFQGVRDALEARRCKVRSRIDS